MAMIRAINCVKTRFRVGCYPALVMAMTSAINCVKIRFRVAFVCNPIQLERTRRNQLAYDAVEKY